MSTINVPDLATLQLVGSTGAGGDYPLDGDYAQSAHIDGSDTSTWNDDGGGGYYGFDPIGDLANPFAGSYDGGGFTITDIFINRPAEDYVGPFGRCDGATISDLGIVDCDITGNAFTGGLVGRNTGTDTIADCYATGTVTGGSNTGGLVGGNTSSSTTTDCYATGAVSGTSSSTGGLVGRNDGTITDCYATGAVSSTSSYTGGFCGYNVSGSIITGCISTGTVTSTNISYLGPFLGRGLELNETGGKIAVAQAQEPDTFLAFGWDYAATWKQAVAVPDVEGLDLEDAAEALALARLGIGVVTNAYSDTVAEGKVISQSVAAGGTGGYPRLQWETVAGTVTGTAVDLTVSLGAETADVPNVILIDEAGAVSFIEGRGLVANVIHAPAPEALVDYVGLVSVQEPRGGEVAIGSTVTIYVLTTPATMTVPNVLALTQAEATAAIEAQAFTAGVTTAYSDTVAAGDVISQSPDGGDAAAYGSEVAIVVSLGVQMVSVPDAVGETQAAATSTLTGDGFTVAVETAYSDTVTTGDVISQDPAAGTSVAYGSEVEITVSLGAAPRTVPGVLCLSQAAATALIEGEGLVASVSTGYSATTPAGLVSAQSPDAGATVDYQSTVAITVSLGREPLDGDGIMADLEAVRTVLSESASFQAFTGAATAAAALDKIEYFAADADLMPMAVVSQGAWSRERVTLDSHYLTTPEIIISLYKTVDASDTDAYALADIMGKADSIMAELEQQNDWLVQAWGPDEETPERAGHEHEIDFVSARIAVSGILRA